MAEPPSPDVFHRIVNQLEVGVYLVDCLRKITYWNKGAERMTGYLRQEVVGRFCRDNILVHCDQDGREVCGEECPLQSAMGDGSAREAQIYLRHHDGHRVPVHVQALPLRDRSGAVTGAAEVFVERVELAFPTPDIVWAACGCLDEETGIATRALTESHLNECIERFENHGIQFVVFVIRISGLKGFRAQHGKEAAAEMLRSVARTLQHALPPWGFLGRWDVDHFLIAMPYTGGAPLAKTGERLRVLVSCTTVPWWGDDLSVGASLRMTKERPGDTLEALTERINASFVEPNQADAEPSEGRDA